MCVDAYAKAVEEGTIKMITVYPIIGKKYRDCNVCAKKASMEVYFRNNNSNQGHVVALCPKCANDCIKRIREVEENDCD